MMPPGPDSPASMPTNRKASSNGAPNRNATRLDMMPNSTSSEPSSSERLIASRDCIVGPCPVSYWQRDATAITERGR